MSHLFGNLIPSAFPTYIYSYQGSIWGGSDRGLGHRSISENPKWVTYQIVQIWRFYTILGYFWRKYFLRRLWHSKNVENWPIFAQKWVTFQNFWRLRRRKVGHFSIQVTPPFGRSLPPNRALIAIHPCVEFGTFLRLKIKTLQIDHFKLFWILKSLLNRQIMKIGHKTRLSST